MRSGKILFIVTIFLMAGFTAAMQVHATETPAKAAEKPATNVDKKNDGSWVSRCQDLKEGEKVTGKYCEALQQLFVTQKGADPSTAQRVAEMAVGYPPGTGKKEAQGVVILPLGIVVDEKAVMEVDGDKVMNLSVRYCDNNGCVALFKLDSGDLDDFRDGKEVTIKTKAATGQPLVISMPLTGFGKIMDSITPIE